MRRHVKHLGLYILLGIIVIILIVVAFGLLQTMGQVNSGTVVNVGNNFVETGEGEVEQPLTEEQQLEVLRELAPEDPVDTPEERQEQLEILERLMNQ